MQKREQSAIFSAYTEKFNELKIVSDNLHEGVVAQHYGLPHYWEGAGIWGTGDYPNALLVQKELEAMSEWAPKVAEHYGMED